MNRKVLLIAAIAMSTSTALAGLYRAAPFEIDLDNRFAQGDMLSVANSVRSEAYIGCGTRSLTFPGFNFRFGFCQAGDDAGTEITCLTEDPALLDAMRASNDHSYIQFSWDWVAEPGGACTLTRVGFSTQSLYIDKVKN